MNEDKMLIPEEQGSVVNENVIARDKRLGKLPAKSSLKALMFDDFLKKAEAIPPASFNHWARRAPFPLHTFGNNEHGCCTIASQAVAALRMERLEQRRTTEITTNSVLTAYYNMTSRLYGGGDTGAYETDALSNWRNPETTFRDYKGRPLTIAAYTRINHLDHESVRRAIWITDAKGIKLCFNLPWAWSSTVSPGVWDAPPEGQQLIGAWAPGSWGGHSMYASGYTKDGLIVEHTWGYKAQLVTWAGAAIYMDEAHWVLDDANAWRKRKDAPAKLLKMGDLVDAVNDASTIPMEKI